MKKKSVKIIAGVLAMSLLIVGGCSKKITGENLKIELEENPTTGYTLVYKIKDEEIVKVTSDEYKAEDKEMAGSGGMHTYVIQGLKEGETTIEFTSRQDWEGGEIEDSMEVTVVVDKELNVTEK